MYENIRNAEVRNIMLDESLSSKERIKRLTKLRDDARAEQRLASEAPAVDDDGLNSKLRDVEMMLDRLGLDPAKEEGKGAATLGNPLSAVVWLAQDLAKSGGSLKAGDLVSVGSFTPLTPPKSGQAITVTYEGLAGDPSVSVKFE